MTVSITIRNVPDAVRDELAGRAASSGRSLQEYLAMRLEAMAGEPDPDAALRAIRARARRYPPMDLGELTDTLDADRR